MKLKILLITKSIVFILSTIYKENIHSYQSLEDKFRLLEKERSDCFSDISKNRKCSREERKLFKMLERRSEISIQLFINYTRNISNSPELLVHSNFNFEGFVQKSFDFLLNLLETARVELQTYVESVGDLRNKNKRLKKQMDIWSKDETSDFYRENYFYAHECFQKLTDQENVLKAELVSRLEYHMSFLDGFNNHIYFLQNNFQTIYFNTVLPNIDFMEQIADLENQNSYDSEASLVTEISSSDMNLEESILDFVYENE